MQKRKIVESRTILSFLTKNTCFEIIGDNKIRSKVDDSILILDVSRGTFQLSQHLQSQKHQESLQLISQMNDGDDIKYKFHCDFLLWMVTNNIPLSKVDNPEFISYLEKLSQRQFYSRQHYMNHFLVDLYNIRIEEIYEKFNLTPYYLMLDETQDKSSRKMVNVLIGELNEFETTKPYVINTIEFENVNSSNLHNFIIWQVNQIHSSFHLTSNFKLLLTDKASYMLLLGTKLKSQFQNLKHITCLCHALHNLCETIRNNFKKVKSVMKQLIQVFHKNKKNQLIFKEATDIQFPKKYISTRWGSYLSFCCFFFENYQLVALAISGLKQKFSSKLVDFHSDRFKRELEEIFNFQFMIKSISDLENSSLSVNKQIEIIKVVIERLSTTKFKERIDEILEKNPDLKYFMNFNILDVPFDERFFNFTPLTTCFVERSFSKLNLISTPDRANLSVENIKRLLFFYFN